MLHGNFIARDESPIAISEHVSAAAGDHHIVVPDAQLLFHADYKRIGDDLKLVGQDGKTFLIADYFKHDVRAKLVAPDGAGLSPDVIEALAGPLAAGQYAQATDAAQAAEVVGKVVSQSGSVQIVRNGVAIAVNTGDTVLKGDVVQTGDGGALSIIFTDSSTFNLSANARMVINEFVYDPNGSANASLVNLVQGTIGFVAGQVAKTGDMKVKTPVATMGIRGTAVVVEISSDNGTTKFSVVQEPNGVVGSYNLYNNTTGALIGTVSNSTIGWIVRPVSPTDVFAQQLTKSAEEIQKELTFIQGVFQNMSIGQQLLNLSDPNNTKTQTAFTQFIVSDRIGINPGDPYGPAKTTTVSFNGGTQGNITPLPIDIPGFINHPPIARPDGEIGFAVNVVEAGVAPGGNVAFAGTASVSGDLIANDTDPDGDALTLISITADGPTYAVSLVANSSGNFTYTLDNTDPTVQALALGQTLTVKYNYTIRDIYGATASATLTVTITGTNDQPVVTAVTSTNEEFNEAAANAPVTQHDADGVITFKDVDLIDTHSLNTPSATFDWTGGSLNSGQISALNSAIAFTLALTDSTGTGNGSVAWDFSITDAALNFLNEGETLTITYPVTVTDNNGASLTQDVVITIHGANDKPVIDSDIRQHPNETTDTSDIEATIPVSFTDADLNDTGHTLTILSAAATGTIGGLALDDTDLLALASLTSITKAAGTAQGSAEIAFAAPSTAFDYLSAGETVVITYTIEITDGNGATAQQTHAVEIHGTNDAPLITVVGMDSSIASMPETDSALSWSGTLSVSDVDLSNTVAASVQGVSAAGTGLAGLTLSNAALAAMLTVDSGNVIDNTHTTGTINWSFDSGSETFGFLRDGEELELTYTVRATDSSSPSAYDEQTVVITITGTNDLPSIAGTISNEVQEDVDVSGLLQTQGDLTIADADHDESSFVATPLAGVAGDNGYGTFTLDATGHWTYTANNSQTAIQELGADETLTDTFTATSFDGTTTQTVTVTINGTNDAPVISVVGGDGDEAAVAVDETDSGISLSRTLTLQDVDGDPVSITVTYEGADNGGSGSGLQVLSLLGLLQGGADPLDFLTITPSPALAADARLGQFTWTFDSGSEAFDGIAEGNVVRLHYTLVANDGAADSAPVDIYVTINGKNDAPVLNSATLNVTQGETVVLSAADFDGFDVDTPTFTYIVTDVTAGHFELFGSPDFPDDWVTATSFANADLDASNVRFVHDGSADAPTFSVQADDELAQSGIVSGTVNFDANDEGPATFTGTSGSDTADAAAGTLTGFTGGTLSQLQDSIGDTFIGGPGTDEIVAGSGNDVLLVDSGYGIAFDGGDGVDTIRVSGNAAITDSDFRSIANTEIIDLNETDDNNAYFSVPVLEAMNGDHLVRVIGSAGDVFSLSGSNADHPDAHWSLYQSGVFFPDDPLTENVVFDSYRYHDESGTLLTLYLQQGVELNYAPTLEADKTVMLINTPLTALLHLQTPTDEDSYAALLPSIAFSAPSYGTINGSYASGFSGLTYALGGGFLAGMSDTFSYSVMDTDGATSSSNVTIQSVAFTANPENLDFAGADGAFPYPYGGFNFVDFERDSDSALANSVYEQAIQLTSSSDAFTSSGMNIQGLNGATTIDIRGVVWDGVVGEFSVDVSGGGWVSIASQLAALGPVTKLIMHANGPSGANYKIDDFVSSTVAKLDGTPGHDLLIGNADSNYLLGNGGSDELLAGGGRDVLVGGAGNDTLTGGFDADVFVFRANGSQTSGSGYDTITDFTPGTDRISINDYSPVLTTFLTDQTEFANWKANAVNTNNYDGFDTTLVIGDDLIVLKNVDVANLNQSDFIVHSA